MKSNFSNRLYKVFGMENDGEGAVESVVLATITAVATIMCIALVIILFFLIK